MAICPSCLEALEDNCGRVVGGNIATFQFLQRLQEIDALFVVAHDTGVSLLDSRNRAHDLFLPGRLGPERPVLSHRLGSFVGRLAQLA